MKRQGGKVKTMRSLIGSLVRVAYAKPEIRPEILKILFARENSVHEWQFETARKLSQVDPSIAKVMVNSGDAKDKVSVKKFSAPAASLRPSQKTMVLGKSLGMALFQIKVGKVGGDLGAIVSSDNHIMDGHHRWSAAILAGGASAKVAGFKAALPGADLVRVLNILTKGAFKRGRGNPGAGSLADYTPGNVRKMLEDFVVNGIGGQFPWASEDVREVLESNFGSVEEGINQISDNANLVSKKVPSWAPARADMPVINPEEVPLAARKLQKGDVDWNRPYAKAANTRRRRRMPKMAARVSREAQSAFDHSVKPYLQGFISKAQAQIADAISDISFGEWPNRQLEQMTMRYKPLSMTDEDFLEEIVDVYMDWITSVKLGR